MNVEDVDGDQNPTELYTAIRKQDWETVLSIVCTNPDQTRTWVILYASTTESGNDVKEKKIAYRFLPLHAAMLVNVPLEAVGALIMAFPEAVKEPDNAGMLPLHYACSNYGSPACISMILMMYVDAARIADPTQNSLPIHCLCESEQNISEEVLQLLILANPESIYANDIHGRKPIDIIRDYHGEKKAIELSKLFKRYKCYNRNKQVKHDLPEQQSIAEKHEQENGDAVAENVIFDDNIQTEEDIMMVPQHKAEASHKMHVTELQETLEQLTYRTDFILGMASTFENESEVSEVSSYYEKLAKRVVAKTFKAPKPEFIGIMTPTVEEESFSKVLYQEMTVLEESLQKTCDVDAIVEKYKKKGEKNIAQVDVILGKDTKIKKKPLISDFAADVATLKKQSLFEDRQSAMMVIEESFSKENDRKVSEIVESYMKRLERASKAGLRVDTTFVEDMKTDTHLTEDFEVENRLRMLEPSEKTCEVDAIVEKYRKKTENSSKVDLVVDNETLLKDRQDAIALIGESLSKENYKRVSEIVEIYMDKLEKTSKAGLRMDSTLVENMKAKTVCLENSLRADLIVTAFTKDIEVEETSQMPKANLMADLFSTEKENIHGRFQQEARFIRVDEKVDLIVKNGVNRRRPKPHLLVDTASTMDDIEMYLSYSILHDDSMS